MYTCLRMYVSSVIKVISLLILGIEYLKIIIFEIQL